MTLYSEMDLPLQIHYSVCTVYTARVRQGGYTLTTLEFGLGSWGLHSNCLEFPPKWPNRAFESLQ